MNPKTWVAGYCPMGCGQTLGTDAAGQVFCWHQDCVRPDAVALILDQSEVEHLVTVQPDHSWTVRHPLRERIQEELEKCALHRDMVVLGLADTKNPGQYRVTKNVLRPPGRRAYSWEPVSGHAQL
jgi:hypothetical protein